MKSGEPRESAGNARGARPERILLGSHVHALDEKRRVAIPKTVREAIDPEGRGQFVLCPGPGEPCVWLFSERAFERFVAEQLEPLLMNQAGIGSKDLRAFVRAFLMASSHCTPDKQGRIVIPEKLRAKARIEREAAFVGFIDRVEVWSPAVLGERSEDSEFDRRAQELFG